MDQPLEDLKQLSVDKSGISNVLYWESLAPQVLQSADWTVEEYDNNNNLHYFTASASI